jgi:thiol:disulfide interchange protein DsbA
MRLFLVIAALIFPLLACAEQTPAQAAYVEGKHYVQLPQAVRTSDPSKIEVVEVFSYHCGGCFQFEPVFQAWKKQQSEDVLVVQSHAMWNGAMKALATVFYTAKALKIDDKTHPAIFSALHVERKQFANQDQWIDFLATFGVDRETVAKTYDSFWVKTQVSQADSRARGYGVTSTPELVVNGKYRTSTSMVGSHGEMLKVVEFLIAKEREAR